MRGDDNSDATDAKNEGLRKAIRAKAEKSLGGTTARTAC